MAGIADIITSTVTMLVACATNPIIDIAIATTPHENPLINPPIILLYCGSTFWARFIVIGVANIVTKPINANIIKDKIGMLLYVSINNIISGNVVIIEK